MALTTTKCLRALNLGGYFGPFGGLHAALEFENGGGFDRLTLTSNAIACLPPPLARDDYARGNLVPSWIRNFSGTQPITSDLRTDLDRAKELILSARNYAHGKATLEEWETLAAFLQAPKSFSPVIPDSLSIPHKLAWLIKMTDPDFSISTEDQSRVGACFMLSFLKTREASGIVTALIRELKTASEQFLTQNDSEPLAVACNMIVRDLETSFVILPEDPIYPAPEILEPTRLAIESAVSDDTNFLSDPKNTEATPWLKYLLAKALEGNPVAIKNYTQNSMIRFFRNTQKFGHHFDWQQVAPKCFLELEIFYQGLMDSAMCLPPNLGRHTNTNQQIQALLDATRLVTALAAIQTFKKLDIHTPAAKTNFRESLETLYTDDPIVLTLLLNHLESPSAG